MRHTGASESLSWFEDVTPFWQRIRTVYSYDYMPSRRRMRQTKAEGSVSGVVKHIVCADSCCPDKSVRNVGSK